MVYLLDEKVDVILNIIDGSKLFMDKDKLLSMEFNETVGLIISNKVEVLEKIALKHMKNHV